MSAPHAATGTPAKKVTPRPPKTLRGKIVAMIRLAVSTIWDFVKDWWPTIIAVLYFVHVADYSQTMPVASAIPPEGNWAQFLFTLVGKIGQMVWYTPGWWAFMAIGNSFWVYFRNRENEHHGHGGHGKTQSFFERHPLAFKIGRNFLPAVIGSLGVYWALHHGYSLLGMDWITWSWSFVVWTMGIWWLHSKAHAH